MPALDNPITYLRNSSGASRGTGHAIALHLASRGASIIGTCSPESLHHLHNLADDVPNRCDTTAPTKPRVIGLSANLLAPDTPRRLIAVAEQEFDNKLYILVSNAAYDELRSIIQLDVEYGSRCLGRNIKTLVLTPDLLSQKVIFQPDSWIVNISMDQNKRDSST